MKVASIVGARPQIVKAAAFSRAARGKYADTLQEYIIHSGQHYDHNLSQIFFEEMGIPEADLNLEVGSASHGVQTAEMLKKFEAVFLQINPDVVIVYGDTNSTLAAALAAAKMHIPVAHIEAGLRSFNKGMPEEINRITTDHCSTLLFVPTRTGIRNLLAEGFKEENQAPYSIDHPGIFHCGDIMYDNSLYFSSLAEEHSSILSQLKLTPENFILASIHRDYNTDNPERLTGLLKALLNVAETDQVVFPVHPRTAKYLHALNNETSANFFSHPQIIITKPLSFFDMIVLEKQCRLIMTDSGGVQKEAYFFHKPVLILRRETEWREIVEQGCGIITDSVPEKIMAAFNRFNTDPPCSFPSLFGDGKAAEFMCKTILQSFA
ncbi:MAG: UDP-N-acetylglucosamine 2-epimerase (non-hydrolyzing) [Bacteroidetes bacterium]|nr:MAG: UDP-N-acetylglucosamine 2-epimerase (non-hydrolyzing) [Bacteroidota bacterium]